MNPDELQPGATYHLGAACGVPHTFRPIYLRFIRLLPHGGYTGMTRLEGYELDHRGDAVELRDVYAIAAGIRFVSPPAAPAPAARRRPTNTGPARIPRPRTSPDPITPGRTR